MPDNAVTVQLIRKTLSRNGYVDIPSSGYSMFPLIREGNVCRFVPFDERRARRGDILLFLTDRGELVGHRYIRGEVRETRMLYVCKGDSNMRTDAPVQADRVVAKLAHIKKKRYVLQADRGIALLAGRMLTHLPFLSKGIQLYLRYTRKKRKWRLD